MIEIPVEETLALTRENLVVIKDRTGKTFFELERQMNEAYGRNDMVYWDFKGIMRIQSQGRLF